MVYYPCFFSISMFLSLFLFVGTFFYNLFWQHEERLVISSSINFMMQPMALSAVCFI